MVITALSMMCHTLSHDEHCPVLLIDTIHRCHVIWCQIVLWWWYGGLKQIPLTTACGGAQLIQHIFEAQHKTSNRHHTVSYSQYCNAICSGFVEEKAMLHWESRHLDVSVPSVSELMMMYSRTRQKLACDVAACRYAFGCQQSSLCGSGTSGSLCFMSLLLHIITGKDLSEWIGCWERERETPSHSPPPPSSPLGVWSSA